MLKGPKIADIDYQMMARWRCKMQYQWMNGACSILFSKLCFRLYGVSPQTSARVPFLDPCSATPTFPSTLRGEYPAGAQA